jgi:transcriptional antiterminator
MWTKFCDIYQSFLRWTKKHLLFPLLWRCHFSEKQLQKKFKHAFVFGIVGHCNPSNLIAFKQALLNHLADTNVMVIKGTYFTRIR